MDARLARDLKNLFRYEPGISVSSSFGRFGLGDIRIRGLGGNRVLIQTDGIPVSDAFSIGSFSNANRDFVDLGTLKQVEVQRGPGSALYGSDALGGVVSFRTKDPEDYLADGKRSHVGAKLGCESDRKGLFDGATLAMGGDEAVIVVEDSPGKIVLQHILVDTRSGHVVKRWRQDWIYEAANVSNSAPIRPGRCARFPQSAPAAHGPSACTK